MKVGNKRVWIAVSALLMPSVAHAHLINAGFGPFYNGALHLIMSPMDVVRLVALCLFAGAQSHASARMFIMVLPTSWFAGGLCALTIDGSVEFAIGNSVYLIVMGLLVAGDAKLPRVVVAILAAICGLYLGFQGGVELRGDNLNWVALCGSTTMVSAVCLGMTGLIASLTSFPFRIGFRVLGSWAAAVGLLSIGWVVAGVR